MNVPPPFWVRLPSGSAINLALYLMAEPRNEYDHVAEAPARTYRVAGVDSDALYLVGEDADAFRRWINRLPEIDSLR